MKLFRRLFHRHTWTPVRIMYRYTEYKSGRKITVKKCQCRECGRIRFMHFCGKTIIYNAGG